jgi:hypothetical protein
MPNSSSPHLQPEHTSGVAPWRAALLALTLLVLGFLGGYGFHTAQSEPAKAPVASTPAPPAVKIPPVVKGLRVSPDGKKTAFTTVVTARNQAYRCVLDLKNQTLNVAQTPSGWQDYIVQWSRDGRKILFDRERIPRSVADTTAGLHEAAISQLKDDRALTPLGTLPQGERSVAGFWSPEGTLIVKTRREPKFLHEVRNGQTRRVDAAPVTYLQNRAVRENGRIVYYVVRDVPGSPEQSALFRVANGAARRISETFDDVEWAYVSETARWMVLCREAGDDWNWTLYRVAPGGAKKVSTRIVSGDVSGVFWSPDGKTILGAGGQSLWLIDIPSLKSRRLTPRTDWKADDAGWLPDSQTIIVAARGEFWNVSTQSGVARKFWRLPDEYWN